MPKARLRLNLSRIALARLKPGARKYLAYDSEVRWLAVEVQPTGHRFFKFIYNSKWKTIGPAEIGVVPA
jgi:hypothetical protein